MNFSTILVYISALNLLFISAVLSHSANTLLLIVSFDGFRHDYLEKVAKSGRKTPNFDKLRQEGVEARHVKNRFITKTFPNHYSIVTGYHEENHGVTANEFYDHSTGRKFNFSDDSDPTMWNNGTKDGGAEPVWVTNEKAEHSALFKKRSGCMMWPGCKAAIHGVRPTWWMAYNQTYPNKSRIDDVIKWFSSEDRPINLGLLYFSEPDHSGHQFGPESEEILDLIVALDGVVGYLLSELEKHHLLHKMNLIITSDHGMAEVDKVIELDKYLNSSLYTKYGGSPVFNIEPMPGKLEEVYDALKKIPHLNTYKKEEIPKDYYYTWNNRIQPIVITAELGYNIVQSGENPNRGNHGYNNSLDVMHPFFIAHGPAFRKNYEAKPFNNIDIYPLMCHILNISPYPNNGSLENIDHILYNNETEGFLIFNMTILTFLLSVGFAALVSGIFCISAFRSYRILLRRKRPMVVRLNNIHDGHTHLLSNTDEDEEEEIP